MSNRQVESGATVSAVERGLDKVGVLFEDGEIEFVVDDVVDDKVGLEGENLGKRGCG